MANQRRPTLRRDLDQFEQMLAGPTPAPTRSWWERVRTWFAQFVFLALVGYWIWNA